MMVFDSPTKKMEIVLQVSSAYGTMIINQRISFSGQRFRGLKVSKEREKRPVQLERVPRNKRDF